MATDQERNLLEKEFIHAMSRFHVACTKAKHQDCEMPEIPERPFGLVHKSEDLESATSILGSRFKVEEPEIFHGLVAIEQKRPRNVF